MGYFSLDGQGVIQYEGSGSDELVHFDQLEPYADDFDCVHFPQGKGT